MINQVVQNDFNIPKIENVVGTITLDTKQNLKLSEIACRWSDSRYNKKHFSGLVAKNQVPKATYMIFSNGKVIITGAKSQNQCQLSSNKLIKKMSKFGALKSLKARVQFKVHNVVATINSKLKINLQQMNKLKDSQFHPQNFPGLIYRMRQPKATFLVFRSGRIVITGVQSQEKISNCFKQFYKILKKYKLNTNNPRPASNRN